MSNSAISGPIFSDVRRSPSGSAAAPSWSFADATGTGVYLASTDVLALSTAGVQRVVVDAAGNVGIGTASPNAKLTVYTGTAGNLAHFTDGINADFYIKTSSLVTTIGPNAGSTNMAFQTGGTERMRLDSGGRLLVNTASAPSISSSTPVLTLKHSSTNAKWGVGPTSSFGNFYVSTGSAGVYLTEAGTSWLAFSDERMKKNIKPLELGLEQIKALKPARFDYNQDESESSARVGFIAQEVLPVLPHAVSVSEDSEQMMGVSATEMIPVLVKAIQELEARLAALESK